MCKQNIYIYPITNRFKEGTYNPYIDNLIRAMEQHYNCVNKNAPSNIGTFNLLSFIWKTKYFYLNWIEDLPDKKGGIIQTLFFILLIPFMKISGKKIIWTIHNQFSHHQKRIRTKKWFTRILMKYSDYRITHSREGINFVERTTNQYIAQKVKYLPHPIIPKPTNGKVDPKYDLIIWGTLAPYKGIDLFLEYLWNNQLHDKYHVLILGKILDKAYGQKLKQWQSKNITIIDKFADEKDLDQYINQSRIVLFTYRNQYVLSSGALIDSIAYKKKVIGPDVGAFKDLESYGLGTTYVDFDDLINKVDQLLNSDANPSQASLNTFISQNSWENFGEKIHQWIQN